MQRPLNGKPPGDRRTLSPRDFNAVTISAAAKDAVSDWESKEIITSPACPVPTKASTATSAAAKVLRHDEDTLTVLPIHADRCRA